MRFADALPGHLLLRTIYQYKDPQWPQRGLSPVAGSLVQTDKISLILIPETFEEIQILKHGYKSNVISATEETRAQEHGEDQDSAFWTDDIL